MALGSFGKPYHWTNRGHPNGKVEVLPYCEEGVALVNYFYEGMPEKTKLFRIERWESQKHILPYAAYRETVRTNLDRKFEELESKH